MKILSVRFIPIPILLLLMASGILSAQPTWEVKIKDNTARMNMDQVYKITGDSLIITGQGDFGRSNVNYLRRQITPEERKRVEDFMKNFPLDSIRPEYFNDYSNFKIIDADNYPRSIELRITWADKTIQSRATNVWVGLFDRIFAGVNPLFPPEVRIKWDKSKFNVFY